MSYICLVSVIWISQKNDSEADCQVQSQTEAKYSIIKDSHRKQLLSVFIAWDNRMFGNINIKK